MKDKIIEIAKQNRISETGFCRLEDYFAISTDDRGVFSKNTPLNFDAKTAIVFAFGYYVEIPSGNISRYAWGKDYHGVAKNKMKPMVEFLHGKGYKAECFADTGCLNERLLASLAGIAFIGKNHMAINDRLGSFFFIGYILTDCEIEPDEVNKKSCMDCGKCVDACPLGALKGNRFDAELCLSYISQKKGELSETEIDALRRAGSVWGCDICQNVCPHNSKLPETDIEEFKKDIIVNLNIDNMTNKEFKNNFGDRAFSWRGKGVILRNQECIYNRKKK